MPRKYICKDVKICPNAKRCEHGIPHHLKEDCDDICTNNITGGCIHHKSDDPRRDFYDSVGLREFIEDCERNHTHGW